MYRQKYFFIEITDVELLVVYKMCTVSASTEGVISLIKFECK